MACTHLVPDQLTGVYYCNLHLDLSCEDCKHRQTTFDEYQGQTNKTALYRETINSDKHIYYVSLGLCNEAGEVAGVVKKVLRDKSGVFDTESTDKLRDEIGDVLWYCAQLCEIANITLGAVALRNLSKLFSRKERGTLQGSGDNR
jgi:NTP pyrophosphatase (non-canonical NTP hydrolase)